MNFEQRRGLKAGIWSVATEYLLCQLTVNKSYQAWEPHRLNLLRKVEIDLGSFDYNLGSKGFKTGSPQPVGLDAHAQSQVNHAALKTWPHCCLGEGAKSKMHQEIILVLSFLLLWSSKESIFAKGRIKIKSDFSDFTWIFPTFRLFPTTLVLTEVTLGFKTRTRIEIKTILDDMSNVYRLKCLKFETTTYRLTDKGKV